MKPEIESNNTCPTSVGRPSAFVPTVGSTLVEQKPPLVQTDHATCDHASVSDEPLGSTASIVAVTVAGCSGMSPVYATEQVAGRTLAKVIASALAGRLLKVVVETLNRLDEIGTPQLFAIPANPRFTHVVNSVLHRVVPDSDDKLGIVQNKQGEGILCPRRARI